MRVFLSQSHTVSQKPRVALLAVDQSQLWLTNLLQVYKGLLHCSAAGQTAITSHAIMNNVLVPHHN